MTVTRTRHFRWGIPDFDNDPWHVDFAALVNSMDKTAYAVLVAAGATTWANLTAYTLGDVVISPDDGSIWVCDVAHTSATSPTTFVTDRLNNPTFWTSLMPDTSALDAADLAEQSEIRASAYSAMTADATRRLSGRVSLAMSQALSATQAAYSMAQQCRTVLNRCKLIEQNAMASSGASASYSYAASRSKRQAAALITALTDDQVVLKSQVFG